MKKQATISWGIYHCECRTKVNKNDNYCSHCGAELEFIECEHKEAYSSFYVDYDRSCYTIYCLKCNTQLADVGHSQYPNAKVKYNVIKEK